MNLIRFTDRFLSLPTGHHVSKAFEPQPVGNQRRDSACRFVSKELPRSGCFQDDATFAALTAGSADGTSFTQDPPSSLQASTADTAFQVIGMRQRIRSVQWNGLNVPENTWTEILQGIMSAWDDDPLPITSTFNSRTQPWARVLVQFEQIFQANLLNVRCDVSKYHDVSLFWRWDRRERATFAFSFAYTTQKYMWSKRSRKNVCDAMWVLEWLEGTFPMSCWSVGMKETYVSLEGAPKNPSAL